jgi:hypothetical protein
MSLTVKLVPDRTGLLVAADYLEEGGFGDQAAFLRRAIEEECQPNYCLFYHQLPTLKGSYELASAVSLFLHLWKPETVSVKRAEQLIKPLSEGLHRLTVKGSSQWVVGDVTYETYYRMTDLVRQYLEACQKYPYAGIEVRSTGDPNH